MNLKVRFKNPVFIVQLILAIITPILAYAGLTFQDITTWGKLGELLLGAISNPYVLGLIAVSVWNYIFPFHLYHLIFVRLIILERPLTILHAAGSRIVKSVPYRHGNQTQNIRITDCAQK